MSLSAFRSVLSQVRPFNAVQQPIRFMAVKATAASTATKVKSATAPKTAPAKKTDSTAKKSTKTTKTKAEKPKKAVAPPKPKKIPAVDLPKRPSTSWALFFVEHLEKVRASGKPVIPTTEGTVAAAIWKNLTPVQKQVYTDRYKTSRAAYEKQISSRLQELTPAEFELENSRRRALKAAGKKGMKLLRDPNAPKRPLSSYFLFAQEQRESGKFADLPIKEQAVAMANAWKEISEREKSRFADQSKINLEAYKAQKVAYNAKHQ
ncbi:exp1-like protein [Gryganskiella cystojenkinii]|nr:exp1-like protein [Gryganskiella cystojenkinii]